MALAIPEDFGAKGDGSTDDTEAVRRALASIQNASSELGRQGVLLLTKKYAISGPLLCTTNITIQGSAANFSCGLVLLPSFSGAAVIGVDGTGHEDGFAYRLSFANFIIDCSDVTPQQSPICFRFYMAYSLHVENVWIYNGVGTGWHISNCNDVVLSRPKAYGRRPSPEISEFGIRCVGDGAAIQGGVTILSPDIEVYFKGITQEGNARVTLLSPYMERNIVGWEANGNGDGFLSVVGGVVTSPGKSGTAANIIGSNVSVVGGLYDAQGGGGLNLADAAVAPNNCTVLGIAGAVDDPKGWLNKAPAGRQPLLGIARFYGHVSPNVIIRMFEVHVANLEGLFGRCDVEMSWCPRDADALKIAHCRFAFLYRNGKIILSPIVQRGGDFSDHSNVDFGNLEWALSSSHDVITVSSKFGGPELMDASCQAQLDYASVSAGCTIESI